MASSSLSRFGRLNLNLGSEGANWTSLTLLFRQIIGFFLPFSHLDTGFHSLKESRSQEEMSLELEKELTHAIYQTLQTVVGPDASLIEQAQKQLKVLQVREGRRPPWTHT